MLLLLLLLSILVALPFILLLLLLLFVIQLRQLLHQQVPLPLRGADHEGGAALSGSPPSQDLQAEQGARHGGQAHPRSHHAEAVLLEELLDHSALEGEEVAGLYFFFFFFCKWRRRRGREQARQSGNENECSINSIAHRPPAAPALPAAAFRAAVHLCSRAAKRAQRVSEREEPRQLLLSLSLSLCLSEERERERRSRERTKKCKKESDCQRQH